jgi:hypothetical protein
LSCPETSLTDVSGHRFTWAADFRVSSAFDAEGLVVEGQFADELTGGVVENADVWVVDEDDDVVTAAHACIGRCGVGSCCSPG